MTTQTLKITQLANVGVLSGTEVVPVVQGGITKQVTTQQIADLYNAAGSGTVTSVALTAPSFLSVAGSPITSAGTLALSLANQSANQVFAGPSTGAATAPTFRALVSADLPVADVTKGGTGLSSLTEYALLAGGTTSTGNVQQVSGTGSAGQIMVSGGTGVLPSWQTASSAVGQALTRVDDTNVTLTLGGAPTSALLSATSITAGWAGQLSTARGGTGLASLTAYAVLTGGTTPTGNLQQVSGVGTTGQALLSNGAAALPTWQSLPSAVGTALTRVDDTNVTLTLGGSPTTALLSSTSITAGWTGQLSIGRGGTGQATAEAAFNALAPTTTRGDLIFRNATTNTRLAASTSGYLLQTNGAGTDPTWSGFLQSGTGAVTRTWQDKARDIFSVKDFGATGDGSTDDTVAIQAAITACGAAGGGTVYFPRGIYQLSALLTVSSNAVVFVGAGRFATTLRQTTLNTGIVAFSGLFNGASSIGFIYSGTPTSGATAIAVTNSYCTLSDFVVRSSYVAVSFSGSGAVAGKVTNFELLDYESVGILASSMNDLMVDNFIINAGSATRGALGGIRLVDKAEAIVVSNGDILLGVYSMTTTAASYTVGVRPAYNKFTAVYFDSATDGVSLDNTVETEFVSCWFSGGRSGGGNNGCTLNQVNSIKFTASEFENCGSNGCFVTASAVNTYFIGCSFDSNSFTTGAGVSDGLVFQASTTQFFVIGCKSTDGLHAGTQRYGITVGASCDQFVIDGCNLSGNVTGGLNDGSSATATKFIGPNVGVSQSTINVPTAFASATAGTFAVKALNTADAASVMGLRVEGDRATPAVNDNVYVPFYLSNGSGTQVEFARIEARASGVTAGAESGQWKIHLAIAGALTDVYTFAGTAMRPTTSDGAALGNASFFWSDLFLASGGVINWNNGTYTLTQSGTTLTSSGTVATADLTVTNTPRINQAASSIGTGVKTISNAADSSTNFGKYFALNLNGTTVYVPCGTVAPT